MPSPIDRRSSGPGCVRSWRRGRSCGSASWCGAPRSHAPSAPGPLLVGADWQNHPRLRVKLDTRHPIYAAHHHKIVVIDDRIAFVGGMDLTVHRWDTSRHAADDPHRRGPGRAPLYAGARRANGGRRRRRPHHRRARARTLAGRHGRGHRRRRGRPRSLAGRPRAAVPRHRRRHCPDHAGLGGRARDPRGRGADRRCARRAAAKRSIYIEAQYTASFVGDVLVQKLKAPHGPEVVIIMTHQSRGLVERLVMGSNRDRLIRRLHQADRHDRLRACIIRWCLAGEGEGQILVHSKLIIVDDTLLRGIVQPEQPVGRPRHGMRPRHRGPQRAGAAGHSRHSRPARCRAPRCRLPHGGELGRFADRDDRTLQWRSEGIAPLRGHDAPRPHAPGFRHAPARSAAPVRAALASAPEAPLIVKPLRPAPRERHRPFPCFAGGFRSSRAARRRSRAGPGNRRTGTRAAARSSRRAAGGR